MRGAWVSELPSATDAVTALLAADEDDWENGRLGEHNEDDGDVDYYFGQDSDEDL
eukprot:gene5021-6120_t